MPSFVCVRLPAAAAEAPEEWTVEYDDDTVVSCLTTRLQQHFRARSVADEQQERATFEEQLRKQIAESGNSAANLTPDVLSTLMSMGSMVDTIPLVLNKPSTGYEAVTLYVDDRGVAKQLERNERATALVTACGKRMDVMGDAFLSRFVDDDADLFQRRDFTLAELDGDAPWVALARRSSAESAANGARAASSASFLRGGAGAGAPAAAPARNACGNLSCAEEGTQRCSRCKLVYYCSTGCQRAAWKRHKKLCTPS